LFLEYLRGGELSSILLLPFADFYKGKTETGMIDLEFINYYFSSLIPKIPDIVSTKFLLIEPALEFY
jgi:hypothetical protein